MSEVERARGASVARRGRTVVKVVVGVIAALVALKVVLLIVGVVGTLLSVIIPAAIVGGLAWIVYKLFFEGD